MKQLLIAIPLILLTGCTGAGFAKGLASAGNDNATFIVNYGGLYGPIKVIRMNPKPGQTVTFSGSDGSITTSWPTNCPLVLTNK